MARELDCELNRLRVTRAMQEAIKAAAEQEGITVSAWRKRAYAIMLTKQVGPGWQKGTTA